MRRSARTAKRSRWGAEPRERRGGTRAAGPGLRVLLRSLCSSQGQVVTSRCCFQELGRKLRDPAAGHKSGQWHGVLCCRNSGVSWTVLTAFCVTGPCKVSFGSFSVAQGGTPRRTIRSPFLEEGTDQCQILGSRTMTPVGARGHPPPGHTEPLEWHSLLRAGDGLTRVTPKLPGCSGDEPWWEGPGRSGAGPAPEGRLPIPTRAFK